MASQRTTGYATVHGARLYYETAGEGHPLVLLHAGITDHRMWDDQFSVFAERYRVVRFDARGFGRSTVPAGPFAMREDLVGLLREFGIARTYVLGLSMGGGVALDCTLAHPELVDALVLAAPAVSGWQPSAEMMRRFDEVDAALAAGEIDGAVELEQRLWVDGPKRSPDLVDPLVRERVRMMNREITMRAPETDRAIPQPLQPPAIGRLDEVHTPTLVVVGDGDVPDVLARAQRVTDGIPGARQVVIADAAHLVNMEQPAAFNHTVLDFLAAL